MSILLRCYAALRAHAIGIDKAMDCHDLAPLVGLSTRRLGAYLSRMQKQVYGVKRVKTGRRITSQGKVRKTYAYYLETAQDVAAVLRAAPTRPAAAKFDASALSGAW
jgi:hypothetical protein